MDNEFQAPGMALDITIEAEANRFIQAVYGWMAIALVASVVLLTWYRRI